jgi:hypothetical protein
MKSANDLLADVLIKENVPVLDRTRQTHSIKMSFPLYLRPGNPLGIVMHNTSGMVHLENLLAGWERQGSPPPSHLAIDQSGRVGFYVKLEYADRATENTNRHISIEFQAVNNGDISESQIKAAGIIYGFLHDVFEMKFAIAEKRTDLGLSHHSLFVVPGGGGHANCPGTTILRRKPAIIEAAKVWAGKLNFSDQPTGIWEVKVGVWTWIYQFYSSGEVSWHDAFNLKSKGTGKFKITGLKMTFKWNKSQAIETWNLPLTSSNQTGMCQMEGMPNLPLLARRKTD